jgi:hypothetical protein
MNTETTARSLAHALLARRRKAKALRLALAEAKAKSMEAVYGLDAARTLWLAVGEAEKALDLHNAPKA